MRFPKGQLPPAQGFWSLTMYDAGYFLVPNVLNRYSVMGMSTHDHGEHSHGCPLGPLKCARRRQMP
jgi:Protein of unknown function (DUF1214)